MSNSYFLNLSEGAELFLSDFVGSLLKSFLFLNKIVIAIYFA